MLDQIRIRKDYFEWLFDKINKRVANCRGFISWLNEKEFMWFVPNDDNRCSDGLVLRERFASERGNTGFDQYLNGPCTMLEMLIALAERMDYILYDPLYREDVSRWFWVLIENLDFSLVLNNEGLEKNEYILSRLLNRIYLYNGKGGLFPLKNPREDQRIVEIWYQMQFWINENGF